MENILQDGIIIMCLGMGFVFLFLTILVLTMNIMSYVIKKINILFPEEIHSAITYSKKDKNSSDSEVALAIALAYVQSSK